MCQILTAALEHDPVGWQDLDSHYVVLSKLNCTIDKTTRLQMELTRIVKTRLLSHLKDQPAWNRLKISTEPIDELAVLAFSHKNQVGRDVNTRDGQFPAHK